jgi:hypothetical protein
MANETASEIERERLASKSIPHDEPYLAPSTLGVMLRKRGLFYRPEWAGYTADVNEAGRYQCDVANRHAAKVEGVTVHEITEFL